MKKGDRIRNQMLAAIRTLPSISTRSLGLAFGMSASNAKWHLNVLEDEGTIERMECHTCGHEMWEIRASALADSPQRFASTDTGTGTVVGK